MINFQELKINSGNNGQNTIYFGEANDISEILETYKLRYRIYSKKGYINESNYSDQLELDDYDKSNKCKYFIAKYDEKIIGTIRMIIDDPLPTEKCFSFDEPSEISKIETNKRCEFGRFVIIPPNEEKNEYFPRGLVMLFMFNTLNSYALLNGYEGGYAFVKQSLLTKMNKFKMPIGLIKSYEKKYTEGVLLNYFNQATDPVVPIYFLVEDFNIYLNKRINNSWLFENKNKYLFTVKSNLYTNFLRKINVI